MNEDERLSRMETVWSIVIQAHGESSIVAQSARNELMNRYGGAARRYLLGALRSENDAEEVYQEFALKLLRGDLHRADPERGKFRKFVKTTLYHLIVDFQRARGKAFLQQNLEHAREPSVDDPLGDECFNRSWRKEIIDRTFQALQTRHANGQLWYVVLKIRIDHPKTRSPELARMASQALDRPMTADNYRAILRNARLQLATLLMDEVGQSLANPTADELESELAELNLLEYCRPVLRD